MSGIAVFNKAVSTLQQSQRNLQSISQARQKMDREKELFELKKKEAEIGLKKSLMDGKMSELDYEIKSNLNKSYLKQEEDKIKGATASIKLAEHQNRGVAEQAMNWAKIGFKSDPQGVLGYLGAMKRNQERTKELRPTMSAGNIGFKEVDVNNGEDVETESDRLSLEEKRLNVQKKKKDLEGDGEGGYSNAELRAAERLVENDKNYNEPYEDRLSDALPKARALLKGNSEASGVNYSKKNTGDKANKIKMRLPDGKSVYIPEANVEAAKKRGAVVL